MTASPQQSGSWLGLAGRVCAVTGAGSGIGAAIARGLAEAGAHVALLDRNADAATAVATELAKAGAKTIAVACDVSRESEVTAAAEKSAARQQRRHPARGHPRHHADR